MLAVLQRTAAEERFVVLSCSPPILDPGLQAPAPVKALTVFHERLRESYQPDRTTLTKAMARFRAEGFGVSGGVTPTQVGQRSTGWNVLSCCTDPATQERVKAGFEFAAVYSDEIMIDDF